MTWGVTFIGQRGQFEIGLKGSLCIGISKIVYTLLLPCLQVPFRLTPE